MHLRFKILHQVFRYTKLTYNYSHEKREDHLRVISFLTTTKHIDKYIQDKRNICLRAYHL